GSVAIIAVIEAISNRNTTGRLQRNTMRSMLIVIRNSKAIEEEVVAVDEVYLAVSARENRLTTMTVKHSVPYSVASYTAIRQRLTSRFERSMESGSRTVARHAT